MCHTCAHIKPRAQFHAGKSFTFQRNSVCVRAILIAGNPISLRNQFACFVCVRTYVCIYIYIYIYIYMCVKTS